jgi:aryl-alcohol dehydrogenase-like predicted oxidoreductase
MRLVELPGSDLTLSRLGFGTAALMARLGRRESVRLLEIAHDSGITHFDTARAYGYGEAEAALGDFLANRRGTVTVTTKLGMLPPRRSRALQGAKALGRVGARALPALRPLLRRGGQSLAKSSVFEPGAARASLETSLRELRVDTVDVLLLHECRPADLETDGLHAFLEQVVAEGKVRAFGIGTDRDSTAAIVASRPEFAPIVQVRQTVADPALELPHGVGLITHSAVGPLVEAVSERARADGWSRETVGRLLLAGALRANRAGTVLFSSTDEGRIRANAALADEPEPPAEELERLVRLARMDPE